MTIENVLDMFYANKSCPAFHDALRAAVNAFQETIINYYEQEEKPRRRQRVRKLTEEEEEARRQRVMGLNEEEESLKAMIEFYENVDELKVFRKYAKEYGLIDED